MRTLRTGLAAALLSAVCCMGLVVTTAQPSAALTNPVDVGKIAKAGLGGLKVGGRGAILGGRFVPGIGWWLAAGTTAWWAYENRDAIVGFFKPLAGGFHSLDDYADADPDYPKDGVTPNGWGRTGHDDGMAAAVTGVSGRTVTIRMDCLNVVAVPALGNFCDGNGRKFTTAPLDARIPAKWRSYAWTRADCKNDTTGAITQRSPGVNGWGDIILYWNDEPWVEYRGINVCSVGETVVGLRIPPHSVDTGGGGYPPQTFGIGWGTEASGLPGGEVKFKSMNITARCKNARTGETAELHSSSDYGDSQSIVLPSCKQHLGDDWYGTGFTIAPAEPEIDGQPLDPDIVLPAFPGADWDINPSEDPQPCEGTKDGCSLGVWIDNQPCTGDRPICNDWGSLNTADDERVVCKWGGQIVPDKTCFPLAGYYNATGHGTELNNDPDANPNPDPNFDPNADPSYDPEYSYDPSTQVGTGTGVESRYPFADPLDDSEGGNCFPSGWGRLNPFEWVYKPVKCAFIWAFKPTTPMSERVLRIQDAYSDKAPFSWAGSMAGLPGAVGGSGCPNWSFTFKGNSYPVLCGTTMGNAMHGARPLVTVLVVGAAVYPMLRALVYAFFPIVKPSPND